MAPTTRKQSPGALETLPKPGPSALRHQPPTFNLADSANTTPTAYTEVHKMFLTTLPIGNSSSKTKPDSTCRRPSSNGPNREISQSPGLVLVPSLR
ncbi:unnamed protein product [Prunus armeniaca]|uniref:Uncharacterized protein n=1 Tax=Prunus armeniaca TaxID=36596 RepID=A0A6J5U8V1_PRUAR|nr:unnamed protein product [Prunus armeniaca]